MEKDFGTKKEDMKIFFRLYHKTFPRRSHNKQPTFLHSGTLQMLHSRAFSVENSLLLKSALEVKKQTQVFQLRVCLGWQMTSGVEIKVNNYEQLPFCPVILVEKTLKEEGMKRKFHRKFAHNLTFPCETPYEWPPDDVKYSFWFTSHPRSHTPHKTAPKLLLSICIKNLSFFCCLCCCW